MGLLEQIFEVAFKAFQDLLFAEVTDGVFAGGAAEGEAQISLSTRCETAAWRASGSSGGTTRPRPSTTVTRPGLQDRRWR